MKILSIETSTKNLSLAVLDGKRVICFRNEQLGYSLSERLVAKIDQVLNKANCRLKDINGIAVGLGPGSFTSLRVGLATAKGLCFASNKPLVGVSSLDCLAYGVNLENAKICVVSDAKRQMVYYCEYEKKNGRLKRVSDYQLLDLKEISTKELDGTVFVGDGIPLIRDEITKHFKDATIEDEKKWYPQAKALGFLAMERFSKEKFSAIDRIMPLYLHPQDCQVRK